MIRILLALALSFSPAGSIAFAEDTQPVYPFEQFLGEWKLKEGRFQQVWDGKTVETLSIPGHRTSCAKVNTERTILCEVDAVDFKGHIMWAVDEATGRVHHLSHFGTSRLGQGVGTLDTDGSLRLRVRFSDEADGTYRAYTYRWLSDDEYEMISRQYGDDGEPTGNWYGGVFVRLKDRG